MGIQWETESIFNYEVDIRGKNIKNCLVKSESSFVVGISLFALVGDKIRMVMIISIVKMDYQTLTSTMPILRKHFK